ncbi:MAG: hypothetical protein WCX88_02020 [Patescibacteria group bacterium]
MSFELGNLVIQIQWKTVVIVVLLFCVPLWIIYRPDLKIKKRFNKVLGISRDNKIYFDTKNNRIKWARIKNLIDPTSPESWRQVMKEVDKIFREIFQKLEPNLSDENQCLEILCQKDTNWLNVKEAIVIKNMILNGQLNMIHQTQVDLALEKFEKILKEVEFI